MKKKLLFMGVLMSGLLLALCAEAQTVFGEEYLITETLPQQIIDTHSADLDSDGDLDILLSLYADSTLVWYENSGNGNFENQQILSWNNAHAYFINTADLDNDGDIDIVSDLRDDNKIVWYENNGNATFGEQKIITMNLNNVRNVSVVDMDNDGWVDVLSSSFNDHKVVWYKNNGNGIFSDEKIIVTFPSGYYVSVFSTDMDNDGDEDVLTSFSLNKWYKNDGNGNFEEQETTIETEGAIYPVDIDTDGDIDIMQASSANIVWYENMGDGNLGNEQIITGGSDVFVSIHTADLNSDGNMDILYTNDEHTTILWCLNQGNGNFANPQIAVTTIPVFLPFMGLFYSIDAGDFDGDGDIDILQNSGSNDYVNDLIWYANDGLNNFGEANVVMRNVELDNIGTIDINGDGNNDVIATSSDGNRVLLCSNDSGNGNFSIQEADIISYIDTPVLLSSFDLDNDTDLDLIFVAYFDEIIYWQENLGNGNFGEPQVIISGGWIATNINFQFGDLDNDSDMDLVISFADKIVTFKNNNGNFNSFQILQTESSPFVVLQDINNDGDLDILCNYTFSVVYYENNGDGSMAERQNIIELSFANNVNVGDFDNDGDIDLLPTSDYNYPFAWLANDGIGSFELSYDISLNTDNPTKAYFADADNDGDDDIFYALAKVLYWQENTGNGIFLPKKIVTNLIGYLSRLCISDLDGDGDRDILYITNSDYKIAWIKNLLNDPKISGTIFYDLNQNGMMETGEYGLDFEDVAIDPDVSTVYTNNVGMFSYYYETAGDYTLNFSTPEGWTATTPTSINLSVEQGEMSANNNFGIYPDSLFTDVQPYITSGINRCSWQVAYYVTVVNEGTVVNPLTVVALQPDEQLTYTTALLAPDSIDAAGVIYWHINNLLPTQQRQLVVNFQVPNFSAMGDILNTQAVVNTYDDAGVLLSQNDFDYGAEVVCSYDPNDKQVTPIGIGAQNYTLINDDELVYTIRFQNTGNDTAFNIIITDTLSQYFDHSSFRLITSSHQMQAYRYPSGLVEFRFNHIMLPDSTTNEPRSHGFVQYAVKAVQPVPANTLITNTAYIYFDQNPAVVTNTIESLMVYQIPVGLPIGAMPKFHCYPNPTNTHLSIQQATNEPAFYTLYNAVGQLVATGTFSGVTHTFSVAHLPSGWYYLEVNGERFRVVKE